MADGSSGYIDATLHYTHFAKGFPLRSACNGWLTHYPSEKLASIHTVTKPLKPHELPRVGLTQNTSPRIVIKIAFIRIRDCSEKPKHLIYHLLAHRPKRSNSIIRHKRSSKIILISLSPLAILSRSALPFLSASLDRCERRQSIWPERLPSGLRLMLRRWLGLGGTGRGREGSRHLLEKVLFFP